MPGQGKKYTASAKLIEPRPYSIEDAVPVLKKLHKAKFDQTVEIAMLLGRCDHTHALSVDASRAVTVWAGAGFSRANE